MSAIKECRWCHLKNSFSITETATCSLCGFTATLCEKCTFTWKNQKCPSCQTGPANAKWKFSSSKEGAKMPEHIGHVKSPKEIWADHKAKREEKRSQDGAETHEGVKLSAGEVEALRNIEDTIVHELKPSEIGTYTLMSFAVKDGKVVELSISHKEQDNTPKNLGEFIGKLVNLEALKLEAAQKQDMIESLGNLKNLKKLKLYTWEQQFPDALLTAVGTLTQLEELCFVTNDFNMDLLNSTVAKLKNLKKLKLSIHCMRKPLPCLKDLTNLEELDVTRSDIQMWSGDLKVMPKIKLVHTEMSMQSPTSGFGGIKEALERNNPAVYPKLSMKDKLKKGVTSLAIAADPNTSPDKARDLWKNSLPEPLKKGWSGIN
jgi:hypothetical protein